MQNLWQCLSLSGGLGPCRWVQQIWCDVRSASGAEASLSKFLSCKRSQPWFSCTLHLPGVVRLQASWLLLDQKRLVIALGASVWPWTVLIYCSLMVVGILCLRCLSKLSVSRVCWLPLVKPLLVDVYSKIIQFWSLWLSSVLPLVWISWTFLFPSWQQGVYLLSLSDLHRAAFMFVLIQQICSSTSCCADVTEALHIRCFICPSQD